MTPRRLTSRIVRERRGWRFILSAPATSYRVVSSWLWSGRRTAVGLAAAVNRPVAHPFARVSRTSVDLRHLHPESLTGLLPDPPLAHAVWERWRRGEPAADTELDETLSRRVSVVRFGLRVIAGQGGEDEAERRQRLVDYACRQGTREAWGERPFPDRRALGRVVWKVGTGSYLETDRGGHRDPGNGGSSSTMPSAVRGSRGSWCPASTSG